MSDLFKLGLEVGTGQKHVAESSSIHVAPVPSAPAASTSTPSSTVPDTPRTLRQLTTELLQTERTYIKRLRALKETYADPLRSNALDTTKPIEILTAADTLVLFSNIDEILPLNEEFISEIWMVLNKLSGDTISDVVLKHFKNEKFQKEYKSYIEGFGGMLAKYEEFVVARTQFAPFLKVADGKIEDLPGVGLKDLLKDPVSRLARYIILFKAMIASLEEGDEGEGKLSEAGDIIWEIVGGRPEKREPVVEKTEI